jgi:uncharacterized protein involved in exopolysaccharide biosynthesis
MSDANASTGFHGADAPPLREFMAHAYAHRFRSAGIFGTVLCVAIVAAALLPTRYRAAATLAVLPAPEFTVRPDAGSNALNASALAMDQIMKAETDILQSDDLHEAVLSRVGIAPLYADLGNAPTGGFVHTWLRPLATPWIGPSRAGPDAIMERALTRFAGDLDIRASKEGNVIDITFKAEDGAVAALVANTLLSAYAARRTHLYDDPQLRVVTQETEAARHASVNADRRLAAFKWAHDISNYDEERSYLLKRRSDAQQGLAEADMTAASQQARIAVLDHQIAAQPAGMDIFLEHDTDTRLQAIDAALVDLRTKLSAAQVRYLDTSRMVTDVKAQIEQRVQERRRLAGDPSPSVSRLGPNPNQEQLKLDRARASAELAAAASRAASHQRLLRDIASALVASDAQEQALDDLMKQKRVADENFLTANRVMAERRLTEAEDILRLAHVRVIEAARVPLRPEPIKLLMVLAGVISGVVAAAGALVIRFAAQPTFLTSSGLGQATGLPVLGVFQAPEPPRALRRSRSIATA